MKRVCVWAFLLSCAVIGRPCIPVTRDGRLVPVASERAVIVWNPRDKLEYFIREADFGNVGQDFGFIVPSPSKPDLSEAKPYIFHDLDEEIAPKIEYRYLTGYRLAWWGERPVDEAAALAMQTTGAIPESKTVDVLGTVSVGGYDATILRSGDAEGLAAWLKRHGYRTTPTLTAWLEPYIRQGWIFTAFKVGKDAHLKPVCMAFKAETPFYPYREPKSEASAKGRLLRVYFFSDQRYDASLQGKPWNARVPYSSHADLSFDRLPDLGITQGDFKGLERLTVFEDTSNPRNGVDDVFFAPGTQAEVVPPPVIHIIDHRQVIPAQYWVPAAAVVLLLVLWAVAAIRAKRRS